MATNTYVALKKTTLTGSATSVTLDLTGVTGYTDLVVVMSVQPTGSLGYAPWFQFNGDTSTNYSLTYLGGNGSSASSGRVTNTNKGYTDYPIGLSGSSNVIAHIMNYSNTTTYKTWIDRLNETAGSYPGAGATVGLWRNTAAITSIVIGTDGTFASGSTFSLYGVAAEGAAAKATGGYITSDANYWYL